MGYDPNDHEKLLPGSPVRGELSDGREEVGDAFADPNSYDDRKLGKSFDQTTSSAKKKHTPLSERMHAPKSRKVLYWFLIGVVVLFAIIFFAGWLPRHAREKDARERAEQQKKAQPIVEVLKVVRAPSAAGLVIPGTTTPLEEAYVYARANGYLKRRLVDIGDHVVKGQLLATIEAPDLDQQVDQARQQVQQAKAQLAQQQSQLVLQQLTVKRYLALVAKGVFSRQQGDQAQADYETSVANVAAAERNVQAFEANLGHVVALQSYERVTAPFTGVITQRNVDVGALISTSGSAGGASPTPMQTGTGTQAGMTNSSGSSGSGVTLASPSTGGAQGGALFAIAQTQRLRILVSVPEGYAPMIHVGQQATVYFQEYPHKTFPAEVTRTAGEIDQNSRTMIAEVQVDNHDGKLLAGMYAVVTFNQNSGQAGAQGPLLISGDAIAIRNDRPTVAVIDNGKVHLQPVEIGRDFGAESEIVNGLKEGQMIAATFTDDVREGASVKTHFDPSIQQKTAPQTVAQPQPPGGSTQYADPGIVDQDMQGQNAKPQQKQGSKQPSGPQKKSSGNTGSQP